MFIFDRLFLAALSSQKVYGMGNTLNGAHHRARTEHEQAATAHNV
jgi:hypothetical protein